MASEGKKERYSRKKFLASIPWSDEQKNIFDAAINQESNILINAKSGVGKTSSICGLVASLPTGVKTTVLAFNRHIANELQSKIPSSVATVTTAHKMGLALLTRFFDGQMFDPNEQKYRRICRDVVSKAKLSDDKTQNRVLAKKLEELCHYVQVTLTDFYDQDAILKTIDYYCLAEDGDLEPEVITDVLAPLVTNALEEGIDQAKEYQNVGLDDLIWLPEIFDIKVNPRDFVIQDESQDSNKCITALCKRLAGDTGKIIFFGDENQSCYGFSGSDPLAWQNIQTVFNPVRYPLTVCRRSPKSHIRLAQKFVRDIQYADYAPEGEIHVINPSQFFDELLPGTLVLCRMTAPLVKGCLKAISLGKKAQVRGRDIGKSLSALAKESMQDGGTFPGSFLDQLHAVCDPKIAHLKENDNEMEAQNLEDRMNALEFCFLEFGANIYYLDVFCEKVEKLFCGEEDKPPVVFSTIHRAKGDESHRVIIIGCNWLPYLGRTKREWQAIQEYNLAYIAVTRCKFEKDNPDSGKLFLLPLQQKRNDPYPEWCLSDPFGGMQFPESPFESEYQEFEEVESLPQVRVEASNDIEIDPELLKPVTIAEILGLTASNNQPIFKPVPYPECVEDLYQWLDRIDPEWFPKTLKLEPHRTVLDCQKLIEQLRREVEVSQQYYQGLSESAHPRSRYGALEADIRLLREYLERESIEVKVLEVAR